MKKQHNNEIYCTNLFLNNLFKKLEELEKFKKMNILIVSIMEQGIHQIQKDEFSVVSMIKENNISKFELDNEITSVQNIVSIF